MWQHLVLVAQQFLFTLIITYLNSKLPNFEKLRHIRYIRVNTCSTTCLCPFNTEIIIPNITLINHKELFSFHFHFTLERLNHAQIHTKKWGMFAPLTKLKVPKPKTRKIMWVHTTPPFMLNNVTKIAITCLKLVI